MLIATNGLHYFFGGSWPCYRNRYLNSRSPSQLKQKQLFLIPVARVIIFIQKLVVSDGPLLETGPPFLEQSVEFLL